MTSGTTGDAAITTAGLRRSFGDLVAVNGIDLTVADGELFALLGPNGAGKTTTIKMLCCLLTPTDGTGSILGRDIRSEPVRVKEVIALSPQETAIAGRLNAWENLALMAGIHGIDPVRSAERSAELLELLALSRRADEQVRRYSGGMQRRLSIAMALISDPQVLFLDEPTIGLDPQSRRGMWEYIEGLKGSKTVVLTTHYLEEADALADRIAIVDEGKVIASGTADELKRSIAGSGATVVAARDLSNAAVDALRERYSHVRITGSGVEIDDAGVDLYDLIDRLRPHGAIQAIYQRTATLDDVFIELTGKQLRE